MDLKWAPLTVYNDHFPVLRLMGIILPFARTHQHSCQRKPVHESMQQFPIAQTQFKECLHVHGLRPGLKTPHGAKNPKSRIV